jgi:hypothetical protein
MGTTAAAMRAFLAGSTQYPRGFIVAVGATWRPGGALVWSGRNAAERVFGEGDLVVLLPPIPDRSQFADVIGDRLDRATGSKPVCFPANHILRRHPFGLVMAEEIRWNSISATPVFGC